MSTTDRTLVKPPNSEPDTPALTLDDASDRVAVLAGNVMDQLHSEGNVDQEDVDDLRAAIGEVEDVLELVESEGEQ